MRTHLPQRKHHLGTPNQGAARSSLLPPAQPGTQGPALVLGAPGSVQLSHVWPCPRFAGLPNRLSFALLMCPLHWAGAWKLSLYEVISPQGILVPPTRAGVLSSALPSSPDLGVWCSPARCPPTSHQEWGAALLVTHKGHRKTSDWTTVSLVILQHEKRNFPTIIRPGRSCNHLLDQCLEQGPGALLGQPVLKKEDSCSPPALGRRGPCWLLP